MPTPTPTLEELAYRVEILEKTAVRRTDPGDPYLDPPGTAGDPQHTDPASIAAWIAAYQALPASDLTDVEYAAFRAILAEKRAADLAATEARMEALIRRYE